MEKDFLTKRNIAELPKTRPSEVLLLASGLAMLLALPFLGEGVWNVWILAKCLYGVGVILFIFNR